MCDGFFFHTDTNIDHRRVPNLTVFFARKGHVLPITTQATNYAPGDLVTRDLGGGLPHIGILVDKQASSGRYFVSATSVWAPKRKMSCSTGRLTATTATSAPSRHAEITVACRRIERVGPYPGSWQRHSCLCSWVVGSTF